LRTTEDGTVREFIDAVGVIIGVLYCSAFIACGAEYGRAQYDGAGE